MGLSGSSDALYSLGVTKKGLTDALAVYFGQCLRLKEGDTLPECPGEEVCRTHPGLPLSRPNTTPEESCLTCERRIHKPGFYERLSYLEVQQVASRVLDLDAIGRSKWAAQYPVELTPLDWLGLKALVRARAKEDTEQAEKNAPKAPPPQTPEARKVAHDAATLAHIRKIKNAGN